MADIKNLTKDALKDIKLIIFDVDGVLVQRGTRISQRGSITTLETKHIAPKQIEQIKKLKEKRFLININSGRGLYMLQEMFREVLDFVSLTYENGSATWNQGKIEQHFNSFLYLKDIQDELCYVKHKNIKGFEPKELIITIHCKDRVSQIEKISQKYEELYCLWNGEAYDIGVKNLQTKGLGVNNVTKFFNLKKRNVLAIGDNYNDKELLEQAGIAVSADKERLKGDYYIPLDGPRLPADILIEQILKVIK
ncbi:MAG: HAD-IIB family hydrolase [Nanoarchaeota archaeon]|nr:HAD-IIB family hydrolase [Nanoarchaeota archaeon]MBU1322173.1 HAD-IIB family hydrolase [Nanoarchaeota archaeon]MBU1597714.1 HAD-IIB family hydrolase [Nanoarchaeota archaeon]MBU2442192.1 HAD-IIB family hydrolase [Nanoarchaeota archaeon]